MRWKDVRACIIDVVLKSICEALRQNVNHDLLLILTHGEANIKHEGNDSHHG
jgi:hypothetical protein